MTTKRTFRPFITDFATPIGNTLQQTLRYDEQRQLSQIQVGDEWVDAALVRMPVVGGTRMTKVHQETTDDD